MPKYDITFARTGSMTVEANSKEEAMRIANQTATVDTVNWCDDLSVTDAEELPDEDPTDSNNKPVAVLPLQDYNLNIRPIGNGYAISIDDGQDEVHALDITIKNRKIGKDTLSSIFAEIKRDYNDPSCAYCEELLMPELRPSVVMLKSGRLWCRKCHCYVPNTANHEMRKEGCFAHSHICGIHQPDEILSSKLDSNGIPIGDSII